MSEGRTYTVGEHQDERPGRATGETNSVLHSTSLHKVHVGRCRPTRMGAVGSRLQVPGRCKQHPPVFTHHCPLSSGPLTTAPFTASFSAPTVRRDPEESCR